MEDINENIQEIINLKFENKFEDEYFKLIDSIEEHWELIEIGKYECNCREDALKIEQEWCEKLRPNLNSVSPFA